MKKICVLLRLLFGLSGFTLPVETETQNYPHFSASVSTFYRNYTVSWHRNEKREGYGDLITIKPDGERGFTLPIKTFVDSVSA